MGRNWRSAIPTRMRETNEEIIRELLKYRTNIKYGRLAPI